MPPAGENVNGSLGGGPVPGRGLACANCRPLGAAWKKKAVAADVEGASPRGGGAAPGVGSVLRRASHLEWRSSEEALRQGGGVGEVGLALGGG